jgi:ABC-2 type transport system permease protein
LSVRENVEFIARIYGSSPQVSRKKADEMLLQFGLTEAFCGALLTNLSAWLSGIWFDLSLVGGWFESLAYLLPFAHAVDATRSAVIGSYESVLPHMWWVIGYAVAVAIIAVIVFRSRMTDDNL